MAAAPAVLCLATNHVTDTYANWSNLMHSAIWLLGDRWQEAVVYQLVLVIATSHLFRRCFLHNSSRGVAQAVETTLRLGIKDKSHPFPLVTHCLSTLYVINTVLLKFRKP